MDEEEGEIAGSSSGSPSGSYSKITDSVNNLLKYLEKSEMSRGRRGKF